MSGGGGDLTVVLPAEPAAVPEFECDPAGVQAFGDALLAASTQVDDHGTFVPSDAVVAGWTGGAAVQYAAVVPAQGHRADAMSLALRHVARRAMAHSDTLTELLGRRDELADSRQRLARAIETLRADVDGAPADQVPALRTRAEELTRDVRGHEADVRGWAQRLATEEQAMREAFRDAGDVEKVEERWGGVEDPADDALAGRPGPDASPQEVAAWWASLTGAQRDAIVAASPGSIGNLDGVPAAYRDQANRTALSRDLHELRMLQEQGVITDAEEGLLENAQAAQDALGDADTRVDPQTGEPVVSQLYLYDPGAFGGDGRMALVYGDLDTADHVSVHVPGMTTDMGSATGNGDDAWATYSASRFDSTDTVASMAWIGYDAPDNFGLSGTDILQVAGEGLAEDGGARLADTMAGIDAVRAGSEAGEAHTTVVGHSYGSTTVAHGASDEGLSGVDDIVLLGSPGAGDENDHAEDLGLDGDHVLVGANSSDPVSWLGDEGLVGDVTGVLGNDPSNEDFGATRFAAEDDDRSEGIDVSFDQHNSYYEQDSESLYNISQVVTGQHDDVMEVDHRYDPWLEEPQDDEDERDVTRPDTGDQ